MMLELQEDSAREYAYGSAGGLPDNNVRSFTQALMDEPKKRRRIVIGTSAPRQQNGHDQQCIL